MEEFKILMAKLVALTITKSEDNVLHTAEGFTISYHLELQRSNSLLPSVQLVLRVQYKGMNVAMWGCMGEEDQQQVVDFILSVLFKASNTQTEVEHANKLEGIKLFKAI